MGFATLLLFIPLLGLVSAKPIQRAPRAVQANILLTNDDGWAVAQIRSEFDALDAAGFNVGFT
jgi:hypothetical protein